MDHFYRMRQAKRVLLDADLLYVIFSFCLPSNLSLGTRSSPVNLSQVCQVWRTVSIARTSLWSEIVDKVTTKFSQHGCRVPWSRLNIYKLFLHRSGSVPWNLEFSDLGYYSVNDSEHSAGQILEHASCCTVEEIFQLLGFVCENPSRIRRLRFSLLPREDLQQVSNKPSSLLKPSGLMQELHLEPLLYSERTGSGALVELDLSHARQLRLLLLGGSVKLVSNQIALESLQHLSITTSRLIPVTTIWSLLRSTTRLASFDCCIDAEDGNIDDMLLGNELLCLSELQTFDLVDYNAASQHLLLFLRKLRMPSLRGMSLAFRSANTAIWDSLKRIVEGCNPRLLTFLRIVAEERNQGFSPRDWSLEVIGILKLCPLVNDLTLKGVVVSKSVFHCMNTSQQSEAAVLVPNLRRLDFEFYSHNLSQADMDALVDMIHCRRPTALTGTGTSSRSQKLQKLLLRLQDRQQTEIQRIKDELAIAVDDGLEFNT